MKSTMLQNPSDPEATFRNKAGKEHRGYAANLEESVGADGSVVTEYQYEQNNHSDSQFIQEHLAQMDNQEERTVIVTDGAYSGTENTQLAAHKKRRTDYHKSDGENRLRISLLILNSTKREQKSSDVQPAMHRKAVLI